MGVRIQRVFLRVGVMAMLMLLLMACSKKEPGIPPAIISPDKMVGILTDVHIAQAAVSTYNVGDTVKYSVSDYMPAIFKNHAITKEQFDSSLQYYSSNPALLDSIYKEVLEELSRKEGELDA